MTSEQFAYWLQGFAELNEGPPGPDQWTSIREHLALVFEKRTPPTPFAGQPLLPAGWVGSPSPAPLKVTC